MHSSILKNDMKTIWIVGQAGPIEGENWRDYRNNQFGKYLSEKCGYNVIWWTSNFSHHFKKYRSKGWKDIAVNSNYIIRLVPSTSYTKNFSVGRFRCIRSFAHNAGLRFETEDVPDLIIGNCVMTKGHPIFPYAKKHNIPIIVDQGDIWPEFIEKNMGSLSKIGHIIFLPLYRSRKKNYYNASAFIALGRNYLDFARNVASNGKEKPYALVYNGIDVNKFRTMEERDIDSNLKILINKQENEKLCIFAGTFGPSYDIDTVLKCAERLYKENKPIKFLFAGSGPKQVDIENVAKRCNNVIFLGSLKPEQLVPVYCLCDIGLCTYTSKSNVDMPDKFYDYTAAGLAIINSLTEEVADHVVNSKVGYNYAANNEDDLYKRIRDIIDNEVLLQEMKVNSANLGKQFDMNTQNAKLYECIKQVIK